MVLNKHLERVLQLALMKEKGNLPLAEPLQLRRVQGRPVRLHASCEAGFRADRESGAIYGPFKITDPQTKQVRFARDAEEASMIGQFCPYCGGE